MYRRIQFAFDSRNPHIHLGFMKNLREAYDIGIGTGFLVCILVILLAFGITLIELIGDLIPTLACLIAVILLPVSLLYIVCCAICTTMLVAMTVWSVVHLYRVLPSAEEVDSL